MKTQTIESRDLRAIVFPNEQSMKKYRRNNLFLLIANDVLLAVLLFQVF